MRKADAQDVTVRLKVNGQVKEVQVHPMKRLLDVLRENLGLTGTKEGCGEGECGACSIFCNGRVVNSCLVPVIQAQDAEIRTIEAIATPDRLHAAQEAFLECGGAQCGICTPGMIISAVDLLERKGAQLSEKDIRDGLAGNLCRCTGYMRIFESMKKACSLLSDEKGTTS